MRKTELLEDQALSTRLKVEAITLREIRMPLVHFFETSFGRTYSRRILLVTVHCDGGDGWAESVAGEDPYYSSEWTESAWPTIRQYLAPAVLGRSLNSARESVPLMAKVRGHRMAKAAVENALWDAEAKQKKQPLWKLLGGTRQEIQCGVSIGIQDSVEQLLDKVQLELAAGYRRIKLKVKPGWDLKILERVRSRWPNILLSCDANSAYTLDDIDHLRKFDQFNLLMIEQPLWNDDIYYHARLQRELRTSICLDESIRHARDCAAAVETGACRIVNIKVGRKARYPPPLCCRSAINSASYFFNNSTPCANVRLGGAGWKSLQISFDLKLKFLKNNAFPVKERSIRDISQCPPATSACSTKKCPPRSRWPSIPHPNPTFLTSVPSILAIRFACSSINKIPCMAVSTCSTRDGGLYPGFGRNLSRTNLSPGLPTPSVPSSVPSRSYKKASGKAFMIFRTRSASSFSCFAFFLSSAGSFMNRSRRALSAWRCSGVSG